MRVLLILAALAGCAAQGQLVQPYYQSGPFQYGAIVRPPGTAPRLPGPPSR